MDINYFYNFNIVSKIVFDYPWFNFRTYIYMSFKNLDWKDKQYAAHKRLSKRMGWDFSDNNPYFERFYIVLANPKIKTKQQMKKECKKHGYK